MTDFVRRVACGLWVKEESGERFHVLLWLEDVSDNESTWTEDRDRAARYFGAVGAHAAAEHVRRLNAASLRKTGEVVRVLRARLKP